MVDLSEAQNALLATHRDRLARVKRGEVLGTDHPGPYTDEWRTQEIARIEAFIARIEAGDG
jgi:hypothetical protein